ncbi:MAG: YuzF family protein [Bacillaceae bacterium]|nr:YuzF family protein [Bacillaceae bacterium]
MYYNYSNYRNQVLPPGYYIHSNQLKETMKATQPTYSINFEPIFFDHLMLHLNERLQVTTINEKLVGELTGVAVDHLQLTINDVDYHIRYEHIIYFRLAD